MHEECLHSRAHLRRPRGADTPNTHQSPSRPTRGDQAALPAPQARRPTRTRGAPRRTPPSSTTQVLYGVPYSEHSSFRELRAFVAAVPARRIVPTVGGGGGDGARRLVALLSAPAGGQ